MAIREKTLDPKDPELEAYLNNLVQLYDSQGKYKEAEPYIRKVYLFKINTVDKDDPSLLATLDNMVIFYKKMGRKFEARKYQ